jgi:APA family basic amino acid/polyamine antiporter
MANLLEETAGSDHVGDETGEHSLKRALGRGTDSRASGAIIALGIFVLTGAAAARPCRSRHYLPSCSRLGACSRTSQPFASMIPVAGSATPTATLGEIAWIIGWDLILEYAPRATVASVTATYSASGFWHSYSPPLAGTPRRSSCRTTDGGRLGRISKTLALHHVDPASLPHATGVFNLVAFFGIAMMTTVLVIGIKESANLNSFIVVVKVTVLLIFIGLGANYVLQHMGQAQTNWTPFIPPNEGEFGKFGISGIVRAGGVIFFAYIGFDAVSTAAQEGKNPKRTCYRILGRWYLHDSLHSSRRRSPAW